MSKFATLLLRSLGRNKVRTTLTGLAVIVLVAIYTLASTVTTTVNQLLAAYSSNSRLLIREKWIMPSVFPVRYVPKIAEVEGVVDWTVWHFYGGVFDEAGHSGAGIATRIDNLKEMNPALEDLDPALIHAMLERKDGALVGRWIVDQMKWKVGQRFTFKSFTHPGKDLKFEIVGVIPSELWSRSFFFHEDYYQEGTGDKDRVNVLWLRVSNEQRARQAAGEIERLFEKSPDKLRVETEAAGAGRFIGRTSTIVNIINFVVAILLVDMVIVLSNSISMTVRERRKEMAILKILGFQPMFILMMVVGEAMLIGALSGFVGASLAYIVSALNNAEMLPWRISFLLDFPIQPRFILHGLVVGAGVGFLGSIIPAWKARTVQAIEAFSNAG
jgi:putative ABC transport system permease protein